jgi:hypothetical protein
MASSLRQSGLYEPLKGRQIRLITIERPHPLPDTVHCQLRTYDFDTAPPYKALSYVWGDPNVTSLVIIDGISFEATTNLCAALRRLRQLDVTRYWIDAICIDQTNDVEKSEQVVMMGEIYKGAEEVPAWLGISTEDSDDAMAFLGEWLKAGSSYFRQSLAITEKHFTPSTKEQRQERFNAVQRLPEWSNMIRDIVGQVRCPFAESRWEALVSLFSRPYWTRVWIIQELALAQEVTLMCGQANCHDVSFFHMDNLLKHVRRCKPLVPHGLETGRFDAYIARAALAMRPLLGTATGGALLVPDLCTQVLQTGMSRATDPRDRVYALLSLVPPDRLTIKVDYSRTTAQVYTDFALSEIEMTGTLLTLYELYGSRSSGMTIGLPSWVPDLDTVVTYKAVRLLGGFSAAGGLSATSSVSTDYRQLSVHGVRHCTVTVVSNGCSGDPAPGTTNGDMIADTLPRWYALAKEYPPVHQGPGFDLLGTFFRTTMLDTTNTGPPEYLSKIHWQDEDDVVRLARGYSVWLSKRNAPATISGLPQLQPANILSALTPVPDPGSLLDSLTGSEPSLDMTVDEEFKVLEEDFGERFALVATTFSFFVSDEGYMGVGPLETLPGDIVCVLLGSDVPLILRPQEGHYTLVGPCYICGIMYGQVVKEAQEGRRQFETFDLR